MTPKLLAAKLDMMIAEDAGACHYVLVLRRKDDAAVGRIWVSSNVPPDDGVALLAAAIGTMGPDMVKDSIFGKGH